MTAALLMAFLRRIGFRILDVVLLGTVVAAFVYAVAFADVAAAFGLWALVIVLALPRAIGSRYFTDAEDGVE